MIVWAHLAGKLVGMFFPPTRSLLRSSGGVFGLGERNLQCHWNAGGASKGIWKIWVNIQEVLF